MNYLLEDIIVIDAASFLAGPGAATIMADYGAKVIKIEPPGGDGYRTLVGRYPIPYHWLLTSRHKQSLGLDLNKDAGQALLHELITAADVLTTNFLEHQLERYNLQYEFLKTLNPRLIFAHISGYGDKGEERTRRAFDVTGWWARSGLMEFIRDSGQTPLLAAPGMGDHATATALFSAIMTGLYRREKTGDGCRVSTSLAANGVWANGMALQGAIAGHDLSGSRQEKRWYNPLTGCYLCADGHYIVLAIINTVREYPRLCEALERNEWLQDKRFSDARQMMRNRDAMGALIAERFAELRYNEVCERLEGAGITFGPVQTMMQVLDDAQLRANGIVVATDDPGEDYPLTIGSPINIDDEPKKAPRRAPNVGADSLSVLREFKLDEERIQALLKAGVVIEGDNH